MQNSAITQSASPRINISASNPEPLVVGNANTLFRLCGTLLVVLIALILWASIFTALELKTQSSTIGRLEEKVLFLEDIVINKTYKVERKSNGL